MKKDRNEERSDDKAGGRSSAGLRGRAKERLKAKEPEKIWPRAEADSKKLLHELEVHRIELEMQNEELRLARFEAEESRAKYADLYDFAPAGYLTLDEKGFISGLNIAATTLLGADRSLLVHKPVVLCTGYSDLVSAETAMAMGSEGFLMKPLSRHELVAAIRRVLDAKSDL
jgi:DNA-binding NarL/FixJ family response regulator